MADQTQSQAQNPPTNKVRIQSFGHGVNTKVFVDDTEITSMCSAVDVHIDAQSCPFVIVELRPEELEIEGEIEVLLDKPEAGNEPGT